MIKGVMFDFSGTFFRIGSAAQWLRAVATKAGPDVPEGDVALVSDPVQREEDYSTVRTRLRSAHWSLS